MTASATPRADHPAYVAALGRAAWAAYPDDLTRAEAFTRGARATLDLGLPAEHALHLAGQAAGEIWPNEASTDPTFQAAWANLRAAYLAGAQHALTLRDPDRTCGAWGGCPLPAGHNQGRADVPSNHAADLGPAIPVATLTALASHDALADVPLWKRHLLIAQTWKAAHTHFEATR